MLWPVLLDASPRVTDWSLGERVSTPLRWLDAPDLPDDLVVRRAAARASALLDADGQPWAQLIEAGGLVAVREGHLTAGDVTLGGCLGLDAFLPLIGELPATVGTVRRVRVLHELHDKGPDGWIRRRGALRLTDAPDASPGRLRDDPPAGDTPPSEEVPEAGTMMILSPEDYFSLAYDRLPAQQWQSRCFLVDLDVAGPA